MKVKHFPFYFNIAKSSYMYMYVVCLYITILPSLSLSLSLSLPPSLSLRILYEVQAIFGHLLESRLQYFSPESFWKSFKLEGQPINVHEHQVTMNRTWFWFKKKIYK